MPNINRADSVQRGMSNRKLTLRAGLACLCGLWLALLSPKVIFGHSAGDGARSESQSGSMAKSKTAPQASISSPAPSVLNISPAQTNIAVGRKLSFRLSDPQGHPIHGATWMVSDFTVAELDSVDPPRIAAVGPGEVTVTAILGDQTVQAKVNVVSSTQQSSARPQGSSSAGKNR